MLDRLERLGALAPRLVYGALGRGRVDALRARLLARSSKRLDAVAAQVAHALHVSGLSVRDRTCLELGSGWVLSHALVLHLLGARAVVATDLTPQAHLPALADAVSGCLPSLVRDVLSPFEDHERLRARLDRLARVRRWTRELLAELGVEVVAPLDLARRPLGRPVDLVYSNSVLEHVPVADVDALLRNVAADLAPGGAMLHAVHLEDHADLDRPFAFLAEDDFGAPAQGARGNRLRASSWQRRLAALPGTTTRAAWAWRRDAALLPARVSPAVEHAGVDDLRTSHVGLLTVRPA